jgi:hypothetical protein
MDHDYELATYERMEANIHHKDRLLKSASYYASIRPVNAAREEAAKAAAAEAKARRRGER